MYRKVVCDRLLQLSAIEKRLPKIGIDERIRICRYLTSSVGKGNQNKDRQAGPGLIDFARHLYVSRSGRERVAPVSAEDLGLDRIERTTTRLLGIMGFPGTVKFQSCGWTTLAYRRGK